MPATCPDLQRNLSDAAAMNRACKGTPAVPLACSTHSSCASVLLPIVLMYRYVKVWTQAHVKEPLLCSKAAGCKAAACRSQMYGLAAEMLRSLKASHRGLAVQQCGGRQGCSSGGQAAEESLSRQSNRSAQGPLWQTSEERHHPKQQAALSCCRVHALQPDDHACLSRPAAAGHDSRNCADKSQAEASACQELDRDQADAAEGNDATCPALREAISHQQRGG